MKRTCAAVAPVAVLLAGCATLPDAGTLVAAPVEFKTVAGAPAVRDGRAQFRSAFCSLMQADGLLPEQGADCSSWLWRMPGEPQGVVAPGAAGIGAALDGAGRPALPTAIPAVVLVTGAFSECVGDEARPFRAAAEQLGARGGRVETIVVSGRSGTAHNAAQLAEALERGGFDDGQGLVLIGYSKGTLDILRFLVDFPEHAGRVAAVVSVAGPVFGSPLADKAGPAYGALLAKLPYAKCPPGDGNVIRSLSPAAATRWLEENELPRHVRYYSLAAFATRERVARALVPSWKLLNKTDIRNDGQVIAADAVIPGSTLLGYANADHWGIAESIETVHKVLAARPDPTPFPLDQLFRAILWFVADDLRADTGD